MALRTWGRTTDAYGNKTWVEVATDSNGLNDNVYLTVIAQVLQLQLNESPFYANYGIPAQQSVMTQVFPDYYAMMVQQQFAQFFASLTITRVSQSNPPVYNVNAVTQSGAVLDTVIAI